MNRTRKASGGRQHVISNQHALEFFLHLVVSNKTQIVVALVDGLP